MDQSCRTPPVDPAAYRACRQGGAWWGCIGRGDMAWSGACWPSPCCCSVARTPGRCCSSIGMSSRKKEIACRSRHIGSLTWWYGVCLQRISAPWWPRCATHRTCGCRCKWMANGSSGGRPGPMARVGRFRARRRSCRAATRAGRRPRCWAGCTMRTVKSCWWRSARCQTAAATRPGWSALPGSGQWFMPTGTEWRPGISGCFWPRYCRRSLPCPRCSAGNGVSIPCAQSAMSSSGRLPSVYGWRPTWQVLGCGNMILSAGICAGMRRSTRCTASTQPPLPW